MSVLARTVLLAFVIVSGTAAELAAAPDTWDPRLDTICDLYLEDVSSSVSNGTYYWRLVSAIFEDESEAGFTHHIYYKCLDAAGSPIEGQTIWQSWNYTNETGWAWAETKGPLDQYWGTIAMAANCPGNGCGWPYNAWVDTAAGPSDKVWGMGMTNPGITPCGAHVNFRLTWQWTQKSGGSTSTTIALNPTSLTPSTDEGGSPPNDTFTVRNSGTGTLNYTINTSDGWLSVNPTGGSSTGEQDTITVSYATTSLAAGTHNATITVSDPAANNPQTVDVTLTVTTAVLELINGDFESGFYNDPDGDHAVADGWTKFVQSGSPKHGPHYGENQEQNVHSINWSQTFYEANYVAGIYQRVSGVDIGNEYRGMVWVQNVANSVWFCIGIDPDGGTNAASGNVEWSNEASPGPTWPEDPISVNAVATSSAITLFVKIENYGGDLRNVYIDDAALLDLGSTLIIWGDDNLDLAVDQQDFGAFQACLTGPSNPIPPGSTTSGGHHCSMFDADGDNDIDLADFGRFQRCFSGPGNPSNCETAAPYPPSP